MKVKQSAVEEARKRILLEVIKKMYNQNHFTKYDYERMREELLKD